MTQPFRIAALLSGAWVAGLLLFQLLAGTRPGIGGAVAWLLFEAPAVTWLPVIAAFAVAAAANAARPAPPLAVEPPDEAAAERLDQVASRIADLRAALADDANRLVDQAEQLATRLAHTRDELTAAATTAAEADAASRGLAQAIAAAATGGEGLARTLAGLRSAAEAGAGDAERSSVALLERQRALADSSAEAVARMDALLEALASRAEESRTRMAAQTESIAEAAARALADTERAGTLLAETVDAQAAALERHVTEARSTLEGLGTSAAQQLGQRLEALAHAAADIETRLQAHLSTTEAIGAAAERAFQLLDARLAHSASVSGSTLDALAGRVQEVGARMDALVEPLKASRLGVTELAAAVGALEEGATRALALLAEEVPQRAEESRGRLGLLSGDLQSVEASLGRAEAGLERLAAPVRESQTALEAATASFEKQREAMQIAGEALVVELEQARQLIAEVEQATEATSLAAATRLVDAMTRVREVAQQTTGTLREMLAGVIGEARDALAEAASSAMQASFAGPITRQVEAAERAAVAAAERSAASLAALAGTLKLLDGRAEDRMAELEAAAQRELAAGASFLTDQLARSAVSIASALGQPMSDEDWARWRAGERTMFRRRAITLLAKAERDRLKGLIEKNPEFAEAARSYTTGFDALLARIDRIGAPGVATALLDSDSGRLAAALAEALED